MKDFIAIDFETANSNKASICSVGVVIVKSHEIVEEIYSLICPPKQYNYVNRFNFAVHGISKAEFQDSPSFYVFWQELIEKHDISGFPVVAHNVSFEKGCLNAVRDVFINEAKPLNFDFEYFCTYKATKMKLNEACDTLNIPFSNHHHALYDALASAKIALKLGNKMYHQENNITKPSVNKNEESGSSVRKTDKSSFFRRAMTLEQQPLILDIDHVEIIDGMFNGRRICITGEFIINNNRINRELVIDFLESKGATFCNNVSRKTDYLLLGNGLYNKTSKFKKAEELNIAILTGENLLKFLEDSMKNI